MAMGRTMGHLARTHKCDWPVHSSRLTAHCPQLVLEIEGNAAANAAGGVYQVQRAAVLTQHRNVSLREQIAHVNEGFHVATEAWDWLAGENIQERLALACGSIKHIHGCEFRTIDPAVGSDPAGMSARDGARELGGYG